MKLPARRRARPAAPRLALALAALLATGCAAAPRGGESKPLAASATAAAALASPAASPARAAAQGTARVERVIDGDTFVTDSGERVRMLGIDTPEMKDPATVLAALARDARDELARSIDGRVVSLIPGSADPGKQRDAFGRLLAYVEWDQDGQRVDVGEQLLRASLARAYPTAHPRQISYLAIEAAAREGGQRVWARDARRAWGPRADVVLRPGEAGAHLGRIARVEGRLAGVRRTQKALFLTLEHDGARLKVVSFQPAAFSEALVASWTGREVAATGKLQEYQGEPELILRSPDQVEIPALEPAEAAAPAPQR